MAETLILSAATAAGGTALPWLSTAGSLASIAGAGGVAGSIAGLSGGLSLLSTGLTAASAFGSIMGGNQQNAVYRAQAQQSELAARQEELKGREQADKIRRSLQATLASQNAAFAARGISLASGTPVNIGNVSRTEAAMDVENAQFGAGMSSAAERAQAGVYRMSGSAARTGGYFNAASRLYSGGGFRSLIS